MSNEQVFYSAKELVAMLRVSRTSLRHWRLVGFIPEPLRIGTRTLWSAEQVAEIIAKIKNGEAAGIHRAYSKLVASKQPLSVAAK